MFILLDSFSIHCSCWFVLLHSDVNRRWHSSSAKKKRLASSWRVYESELNGKPAQIENTLVAGYIQESHATTTRRREKKTATSNTYCYNNDCTHAFNSILNFWRKSVNFVLSLNIYMGLWCHAKLSKTLRFVYFAISLVTFCMRNVFLFLTNKLCNERELCAFSFGFHPFLLISCFHFCLFVCLLPHRTYHWYWRGVTATFKPRIDTCLHRIRPGYIDFDLPSFASTVYQ